MKTKLKMLGIPPNILNFVFNTVGFIYFGVEGKAFLQLMQIIPKQRIKWILNNLIITLNLYFSSHWITIGSKSSREEDIEFDLAEHRKRWRNKTVEGGTS